VRYFTIFLILALVAAHALAADIPRRPNILFVLIDDMGYRDLSCFGGSRVDTAEIDRLAGEGIRLTQFYVNSPICSPSRVAFTTGQYPNRWNITSYLAKRDENRKRGIADWLSPKAPSLARSLAQAGYRTAHVGKWHMGGQRDVNDAPPITDYGFASSLTNFEGLGERILPLFETHNNGKPFHHQPTKLSAEFGGGSIRWVPRHKVTEAFVDRAIEEIRRADGRRPFYVNLWLDDVHGPVQASPDLRGDGSPEAHYLGVMKEMDRQLGRLFACVRSKPSLRDNTIILLASDNGPEQGLGSSGEFRGAKGQLYEGGIRSPLITWYSRIPESAIGSRNERTVLAAMDFPPSLLAMADIPVPDDIDFDGLNMADALTGRATPVRDQPIMWVRPPDRPGPDNTWPDLAIRDGDWKLLIHRDGSRPELFNLAEDPNESNNLVEQHPDRVETMSTTVNNWDQTIRETPSS
jgi:uncharacterized sulfatase